MAALFFQVMRPVRSFSFASAVELAGIWESSPKSKIQNLKSKIDEGSSWRQHKGQGHTDEEPADVCPPGYTPGGG